jgi:predicted PurR-regulated permease PerM
MSPSPTRRIAALPWDDLLVWGLIALGIYALRDVFPVAFLTFLFTYAIRSLVLALVRRLHLGGRGPGVERWLTLAVFAAIVALLWGLGRLAGPQLVLQGRVLIAGVQRLEPSRTIDHVLGSTVGPYLFAQQYGGPGDPRYESALQGFESQSRVGEGAFSRFGHLQDRVQAQFEIAQGQAERQRLGNRVAAGGAASRGFQDWFAAVKAPALVQAGRAAYLARWEASRPPGAKDRTDPAALERDLAELALADLRARPAELAALVREWESGAVEAQWRGLQGTAAWRRGFCDWYQGQRARDPSLPYDCDTYLALREAYTQGLAPFGQVYRAHLAEMPDAQAGLRADFERATAMDLGRTWWASSPAAASLRSHLSQDPAEAAAALAGWVEGALRSLIALPAQIVTALLLTILIAFDMTRLKEGAIGLSTSRIGPLYDRVVPSLTAVGRLIGRSFAAQGAIAAFNALASLALMGLLGLDNALLLAGVVFLASFIPVLGILLSGVPMTLQALLQPDGSLALALYVVLGIAAIHALEALVLSPRIVGKLLHLHPVLVTAVLILGEHLFGFWGLLLGVPVTVFVIHDIVLKDSAPPPSPGT